MNLRWLKQLISPKLNSLSLLYFACRHCHFPFTCCVALTTVSHCRETLWWKCTEICWLLT